MDASLVELVDTSVLRSDAVRRKSSSLLRSTKILNILKNVKSEVTILLSHFFFLIFANEKIKIYGNYIQLDPIIALIKLTKEK